MKNCPIIYLIILTIFCCSCNRKIIGEYENTEGFAYRGTTVKIGERKKMSIVGASCTSGKVLRGYYKNGIRGISLETVDTAESKINIPFYEITEKKKIKKSVAQIKFQVYDNTTWFHIPSAEITGEEVTIETSKYGRILIVEYEEGTIPNELEFSGNGYKKYNLDIIGNFETGYKYEIDIFLDFDGMENFLKLKKENNVRVRIRRLDDDRIELIEKYGNPIFPDNKIKRKLKRMNTEANNG